MNLSYINILDLLGVFAFAVSGALSAAEKKYDLFGVLFVASITAIGGGTTRDLLLGITPVSWMNDYSYIITISIAVVSTFVFYKHILNWRKTLFLFDSIGLGVFTILGMEKALSVGVGWFFAIIMGVFSAVLGGVFRDILKNEIYATACFLGAFLLSLMHLVDIPGEWSIPLTILIIIGIRILSVKYQLSLPTIKVQSSK
jgi:uncharacterized membrane protein YeiH